MSAGKSEKARKIIDNVAKVNKVAVPTSLSISCEKEKLSIRSSLLTLVTSRILLLRFLVLLVAWYVTLFFIVKIKRPKGVKQDGNIAFFPMQPKCITDKNNNILTDYLYM